MSLMIQCSGCNKKTESEKLESFDGCSSNGVLFKKQLCPVCVKEIVDKFRKHLKEKEASENVSRETAETKIVSS